jgi:hypothetical protein
VPKLQGQGGKSTSQVPGGIQASFQQLGARTGRMGKREGIAGLVVAFPQRSLITQVEWAFVAVLVVQTCLSEALLNIFSVCGLRQLLANFARGLLL